MQNIRIAYFHYVQVSFLLITRKATPRSDPLTILRPPLMFALANLRCCCCIIFSSVKRVRLILTDGKKCINIWYGKCGRQLTLTLSTFSIYNRVMCFTFSAVINYKSVEG